MMLLSTSLLQREFTLPTFHHDEVYYHRHFSPSDIRSELAMVLPARSPNPETRVANKTISRAQTEAWCALPIAEMCGEKAT
jgi:hypothetical protein